MLLQDAVSASLIVAADHYGEDSLAVLRALVELQRSGIEPRHLRGFRAAAERELGLIESALIPVARRTRRVQPGEGARARARDRRVSSRSCGRASSARRFPVVALDAASAVNTGDTPGR